MIPAEEFFNLKAQQKGWKDYLDYLAFDTANTEFDKNLLIQWTIEFAKLCCAEQAEVICKNVTLNRYFPNDGDSNTNEENYQATYVSPYIEDNGCSIHINKDSIINAYPLDLIK